ncbi:MAG: hypothetical protein AB8G14_15325 [Ilumatobacter sp.]
MTSLHRTRWAAVGAAVAVTLGGIAVGGLNIANADISSGDRPVFVPINPCRLMDTRSDQAVGPKSSPLGPGETVTVTAHGANGECADASAIPTDAVSLSLNVTATRTTANTFLTFWGDGDNPGTSNLNPRAGGAPTPNSVNTPLSETGTFNIFNNAGTTDVIVDVNGYYAHHDHDDRYYTETEVDAAIAAAIEAADLGAASYPDTLRIGPADFAKTDGLETSDNNGVLRFVDGPNECFIAAIPTPPSTREITAIELRFSTPGSEADLNIDITRPTSTIGSEGRAELVISRRLELLTATEDRFNVQSESLSIPADTELVATETYSMVVCSNDPIEVYGFIITTTA